MLYASTLLNIWSIEGSSVECGQCPVPSRPTDTVRRGGTAVTTCHTHNLAHSSQFTAHTSQLTAHSSQLTA